MRHALVKRIEQLHLFVLFCKGNGAIIVNKWCVDGRVCVSCTFCVGVILFPLCRKINTIYAAHSMTIVAYFFDVAWYVHVPLCNYPTFCLDGIGSLHVLIKLLIALVHVMPLPRSQIRSRSQKCLASQLSS